MPFSKDAWSKARAGESRAAALIERCTIRRQGEGAVELVISGKGFVAGAAPPHVFVEGRPARSVKVESPERVLVRLDAAKAGETVVLELAPVGTLVGRAEEDT